MIPVKKAGQRFTFQGNTLTVKSFFGETGIEYDTAAEAKKNNTPGSMIFVKNEDHGGATDLTLSLLKIDADTKL